MKVTASLVLLVIFLTTGISAGTITDPQLGYSIYLPDNWTKVDVSATQHRFEDTSGTYLSMIVLVRYDFSTETVFSAADEWTRANFIAYKLSIDVDPFSAVVYYDTVTAEQNGTLWAADAYSQFYSIDTVLGDWSEYIRFTASGTHGYEIYAIGPADDMAANAGHYVAIIEGITLPVEKVGVEGNTTVRCESRPVAAREPVSRAYDLRGRRMDALTRERRAMSASQIMVVRDPRQGNVITSFVR